MVITKDDVNERANNKMLNESVYVSSHPVIAGFFLSEAGMSECEVCECHSVGAVGQVCAAHSGQCVCAHPSLTGRRCDQCQDLFFGFNPSVGRSVL